MKVGGGEKSDKGPAELSGGQTRSGSLVGGREPNPKLGERGGGNFFVKVSFT